MLGQRDACALRTQESQPEVAGEGGAEVEPRVHKPWTPGAFWGRNGQLRSQPPCVQEPVCPSGLKSSPPSFRSSSPTGLPCAGAGMSRLGLQLWAPGTEGESSGPKPCHGVSYPPGTDRGAQHGWGSTEPPGPARGPEEGPGGCVPQAQGRAELPRPPHPQPRVAHRCV